MAYLGLVSSQHSRGSTIKFGCITKTGTGQVRKLPTESAHAYGLTARESRVFPARLGGLPQDFRVSAEKARLRLRARLKRLQAGGKNRSLGDCHGP